MDDGRLAERRSDDRDRLPFETFEQKVDRRFAEVTDALVELREYTELGYSRLDAKLDGVDVKVDRLDAKLAGVDTNVERLASKMTTRFGRLERKLDQFIDTQL